MKLATFDDLGYVALQVARRLPFRSSTHGVGTIIADLDRLLRIARRRRVEANLRLCFPELSFTELDALVRAVFRDRWSTQGGTPSDNALQGMEHLQEALRRGKGVILWQSTFGGRHRLQQTLLRERVSLVQVQGAEHGGSSSWIGQKLIRHLTRKSDEGLVPEIIDIQEGGYTYLRTVKERLAENKVVCINTVGPKGRNFIGLSLLGRREYLATGVPSLARATGAALIPVFCFHDTSGTWRTVLEPEIELDGVRDRRAYQEAALRKYIHLIESYVRRYPEQWRRWHTDPLVVGKPDLPAATVDLSGQPDSETA